MLCGLCSTLLSGGLLLVFGRITANHFIINNMLGTCFCHTQLFYISRWQWNLSKYWYIINNVSITVCSREHRCCSISYTSFWTFICQTILMCNKGNYTSNKTGSSWKVPDYFSWLNSAIIILVHFWVKFNSEISNQTTGSVTLLQSFWDGNPLKTLSQKSLGV